MKNAAPCCDFAIIALVACVLLAPRIWAQPFSTNDPTSWWPDPNSGLMWTGEVHENAKGSPSQGFGFPWKMAAAYCANLKLGGFSGWRLPTLDEAKAATEMRNTQAWMNYAGRYFPQPDVYKGLFFKGRSDLAFNDAFWTSTNENGSYWWVWLNADVAPFGKSSPDSAAAGILCVRAMDPKMVALAKEAHLDVPIATMQDLQAYVSLSKARSSFEAAQYADTLEQSQAALDLKPGFVPALVGIGLSSGMLNQWDKAVSNLQAAYNLERDNPTLKAALKWAKNGQKASAKGKLPKGKIPAWN